MQYIGIDLHAQHFSVAVLKEGKFVFETTVVTSPESLVQTVEAIASPKAVVMEESTCSAWAFRVLQPHVDRLVIADPCHNRWIGRDEKLDDVQAARKLAQLLQGGFIRPVHHAAEEGQAFKELVLLHHQTSRELTRFKNRLKAKFRQHGVPCTGRDVYRPACRAEWIAKLRAPDADFQAELLLATIDHLTAQKKAVHRQLALRARQHPEIDRFQGIPGVGLIHAATFFAIVDTPQRFTTRGKLWTYCGIGLAARRSDAMSGPEHLTRRGNRLLKSMAKSSALRAITLGDNRFARQYRRLTQEQHQSHANAWLTVSRAMVSTLTALWCKGEDYHDLD